jgi:hypothetical protein
MRAERFSGLAHAVMSCRHTFLRRSARVEATAMTWNADLQGTPRALLAFGARRWAIGVNAESAR